MRRESEMLAAASALRTTISDLFQAQPAERIVLAPGILVPLQILFAHLGVRRILLTTEEYYDESHFPAQTVRASRAEAIPELVRSERFDAVIASPASWRGERLDVRGLFQSIRDQLGLPVRFVGVGESAEDLEEFDAERFLDALLEGDAG